MKQIKLQETQFGNDKLFQQAQILKDNPELLEGNPVEFEIVSPDYEHIKPLTKKKLFDKKCRKCPNIKAQDHYSGRDGYTGTTYSCKELGKEIVNDEYGVHYYDFKDECPLNKEIKKGKKLGTMKLELESVGTLLGLEGLCILTDEPEAWFMNISSEEDLFKLTKEEFTFLKGYIKPNDLVVVLKVSEVVRYEN